MSIDKPGRYNSKVKHWNTILHSLFIDFLCVEFLIKKRYYKVKPAFRCRTVCQRVWILILYFYFQCIWRVSFWRISEFMLLKKAYLISVSLCQSHKLLNNLNASSCFYGFTVYAISCISWYVSRCDHLEGEAKPSKKKWTSRKCKLNSNKLGVLERRIVLHRTSCTTVTGHRH